MEASGMGLKLTEESNEQAHLGALHSRVLVPEAAHLPFPCGNESSWLT